jgi:hypothetical protein
MASINICERKGCKSFVKGNAIGAIQIAFSSSRLSGDVISMELCPGCMSDVHSVLFSEPVTPRENAYEEPFNPVKKESDDTMDMVSDEQLAAELFQRMMRNARKEIESKGDKS